MSSMPPPVKHAMMIDFHAHVQPGADHGCTGSDMAQAQLALARDAGMGALVAVSHYYPMRDDFADHLRRRERAASKLQAIAAADASLPRVFCGSEVTLCPGLDRLDGLENLCISRTNALLVEMPSGKWSTKLTDTLERIRYERGLDILLAHAERYGAADVEQLLMGGYPCQLNFDAFARMFGTRRLRTWAQKGWVHALGSDIHGVQVGYKHLPKVQKVLGRQLTEEIWMQSARLLGLEVKK